MPTSTPWPNADYAGSELTIAAGAQLSDLSPQWGFTRTIRTKDSKGDATGVVTTITGSPSVQQSESNATEENDTSIVKHSVLLFVNPFVDNNYADVVPAVDDVFNDPDGTNYKVVDVQNQKMNGHVVLWEVRATTD